MTSQRIKFHHQPKEGFYSILRKRVNNYFEENNLSKGANTAMIVKTVFILTGFVLTYVLLLSNLFSPWILLLLAAAHGFFTALIGLNIAHDAIHGAYSSNEKVNKFLGSLFNIVGANDNLWKFSHNVVHHTYTNIPDHDGDINQVPILRLNPNQKMWWIHRYQHFYAFLLYPLASISWVMIKDYVTFFKAKIGNHENNNRTTREFVRMMIFKIIYYITILVIPILVIELPWYYIIFGFIVLHLVEGLSLSVIFQLAHVVENTAFPKPDENGRIGKSWAEHQMYTTANFATNSPVVNFLFGGLNFQVEHHLFPQVCHIHYKQIAPIVKETAEEAGLPYNDYPTLYSAIRSHVKTLKYFGTHKEIQDVRT